MDSWFKDLERAKTEAEIVAGARDYCSLLNPRELDALPKECREIHIEEGVDIPRLRAQLSDVYSRVRDREGETEGLRHLVDYLSRASERLGELRGPH
jgi:hypothetical protein